MKYAVRFVDRRFHGAKPALLDRGTISLNDTVLLLQGSRLTMDLPFLFYTGFVSNFLVPSLRTVPYGVIVRYRPGPHWWPRTPHRILYLLPGRQKASISFRLLEKDENRRRAFVQRLQAAIHLAQTGQAGRLEP